MTDTYHITPSNDIKPHIEVGDSCWCKPETREEFNDVGLLLGWIVIHNAADGREDFETGKRKPS